MFRELNYEELYRVDIKEEFINHVVDLLKSGREPEKPNYVIPKIFYVVYTNCLGDMMDESSSSGFVNQSTPDIIYVDKFTEFGKDKVIAHEMVHFFQNYMYFIQGLGDWEDWAEVMARDLESELALLMKKSPDIEFTRIARKHEKIKRFIDEKERKNCKLYDPDKDNPIDPIDDYFQESLIRHAGMEDIEGMGYTGYSDEERSEW